MKKKLIILTIATALLLPIFKVNYYNGEGMEVRKQSIIKILIQDIQDGTVGTNYLSR